jgi:hypothetical protein
MPTLREKIGRARSVRLGPEEIEALEAAVDEAGSLSEHYGPEALAPPATFSAVDQRPSPERRRAVLAMSELGRAVLDAEDQAARARKPAAASTPATFSAPAEVNGIPRARLDVLLNKGELGRHALAVRSRAARPA